MKTHAFRNSALNVHINYQKKAYQSSVAFCLIVCTIHRTTSTTCSEPSRSVLAPPKLIDLANIFGTGDEEPQQNKNSDKVNNQNVTKV